MFYLPKDDVEEFQNKCVIALFLDYHNEIAFDDYIEKNHFLGRLGTEDVKDFYLFNTPEEPSPSGIVYRKVNRGTARNFEYRLFKETGFIEQYLLFIDNPYEYIKVNFFEREWEYKYKGLFVSVPPADNIFYKYRADPGDEKSQKRFVDFVNGQLTFVNPDTCNDPFDCDCEFDLVNDLPLLLYKAILKTKYSKFSAPVIRLETLTAVINRKFGPEFDDKEIGENLVREILREAYEIDKKKLSIEKENAILKYYLDFSKTINIKNEFRILCLAQDPKDILMWGYYGNSGKGICVEHKGKDIETAISTERKGICVYGNVHYPKTNQKPRLRPSSGDMLDNLLTYIIDCTFSKFYKWSHEEEFRYLLLFDDFSDVDGDNNYVSINLPADEVYLGCLHDKVPFYSTMTWPIEPHKLDKHPMEYRLVQV